MYFDGIIQPFNQTIPTFNCLVFKLMFLDIEVLFNKG